MAFVRRFRMICSSLVSSVATHTGSVATSVLKRSSAGLALAASLLAGSAVASAEPITVRFLEGVTRGFPVLRSVKGEILAHGDLVQIARADRVESRMVFLFLDGSRYEETVVYSQRDMFTLLKYNLLQRGPSFPETIEASVDRATGRYEVRYRADEDSDEEVLKGRLELSADVYNGMLTTLLKNLGPRESHLVQIIAFTPKPRFVKMLLQPASEDPVQLGHATLSATRFLIRPQLGLFASLLVTDLPDVKCWIVGGEAPAFFRFEGPLYFMGPIWRIELN
jgi:hypothetical protein